MLRLFQEFVTPQQKKLAVMVEKMGRDTTLKDDQAMEKLAREESALTARSSPGGQRDEDCPFDLVELRHEIRGNPDEAIRRNAELFNGKFDVQRRQIAEDVARAINQEGDRIIFAMGMGPHTRIIDPVRN